jgi:hypothetical protein
MVLLYPYVIQVICKAFQFVYKGKPIPVEINLYIEWGFILFILISEDMQT